jgi:hypothetical protein
MLTQEFKDEAMLGAHLITGVETEPTHKQLHDFKLEIPGQSSSQFDSRQGQPSTALIKEEINYR